MATFSFWARTTSSTANATTLVVGPSNAVQISFSNDNPNIPGADQLGDLVLESNNGAPDPDTWVIVNGVTHTFTYDIVGTFPVDGKVPLPLRGKQVAVIRLDDGTAYFFVTDSTGTQALMDEVGGGRIALDAPNPNPPPDHVCFCAGTMIATPSGDRAVETLCAGDIVLTASGETKQVMWIGSTHVSRDAQRTNPRLCPIMIPANAFGHGLPTDDLHLSPQHRVLIEGPACELLFGEPAVLVPARFLVDTFAEQAEPGTGLEYFHILLEDHDILLSNGLPTESFQPARRTMDVMGAEARQMLEAVLAALGEEALLSRKDSFLSLRQREARVLLSHFQKIRASYRPMSAVLRFAAT